ncbi:MAG: 2,4-dichlorophenol 6-monooxygenase, partial [Litoreibacter sp.]|nr:2,4-dichlorophenol 6-monooxygenase [Litoreibacter sp.]
LDLAGGGAFTLFTGLGGMAWANAADKVAKDLGIKLRTHVVGPRQEYIDHTGDWARAREIGDAGCIITRPDQHVCWRNDVLPDDPAAELTRVLTQILAR